MRAIFLPDTGRGGFFLKFSEYAQTFTKILNGNGQIGQYDSQYDAYQLLLDMERTMKFREDRPDRRSARDYALKVSGFVRDWAEYQAKTTGNPNFEEMYWLLRLFESPYLFDSYLIYLEKDRVESNKFYAPKREQLTKSGIIASLQDLEDDKLKLLTISMPPGTQKTTALKFFASWVIGKHPKDYNLFFSHSGDITRMFYDGVLDITTSEEYRWHDIFPNVRLKSTDAKREQITFGNYKPFPNLQCSSVGSKNAGKVRCNRYLFCDDLIGGIEEAMSKTRLDKLWSIYAVDARQRKLNQDVKEVHIATRWSVHDVIGRLKDAYGNDERARFIAIPDIDPVTGESNFNYKYNGMTTEFFHDQELLMDDVSYRCLYKNEPIEREGLLYHEDDLRRYLELPLHKPDAILSIVDTKNKGSDYFVQPVFLKYGEDYYLTDCICSPESDYEIQYSNSANIIVRNNVEACHYESNNGGDRVSFEVNKRLKDTGYYCNITQDFTTANKETKIIIYAPWVKQHVLFKDKSMYTAKEDYGVMISQLLSYSLVGKVEHDDVCDVLSSFAKRNSAIKPQQTKIVSSLI